VQRVSPKRSVLVAIAVAAVSLAIPGAGSSAAPAAAATSFSVVGYEYAFTQTLGCFAGTVKGSTGGDGGWTACVRHNPLGSAPAYVTGGTFAMTTAGPGFTVDGAKGSFVGHGGTIATLDRGAGCKNQRYSVTGALRDVGTLRSGDGSGSIRVVLTHYRLSIFGHCVIYKARIAGSVSFSF
jgi:hypothetical protein